MMEFLIALMPVLVAFLGFTQFCFAGIAKLTVRHAAALVTRAAVVVIEESKDLPGVPEEMYGGFLAGGLEVARPPGKQSGGGASVQQSQTQVSTVTGSGSPNKSTSQNMQDLLGSVDRTTSRIKQIRTAAYIPLLAISPSLGQDGVAVVNDISNGELFQKTSVKDAIGTADLGRIVGALLYNMGAVAVTFPKEPGSKELTDGRFGKDADHLNEMVTARVTYLFRCQVPLASLLMCSSGWSLLMGDAWFDPLAMRQIVRMVGDPPKRAEDLPKWADQWKQEKTVHDRQQQRVDAFKGHAADFQEVEWPFMLDVLLALPGTRYMVLSAEAQLPLQGAKYYPRVSDEDMDKMWKDQEEEQKNGTQMPDVRAALQPVANAVNSAASAIDKEVDSIQGTVNDIRGQVDNGVKAVKDKVKEVKQQAGALVDGAKQSLKDVENKVAAQLKPVQDQLDSAKKAASRAVSDAQAEAKDLVNDAQHELDGAKAEVRRAQAQGGAALATAQQHVQDAQQKLSGAQRDASAMVDKAQRAASDQIATAQGQYDKVKSEGDALVKGAQDNLSYAQGQAQNAIDSANSEYNDVMSGTKSVVNDAKGSAGKALSGVKNTASKASSQVGDLANKAASSAGTSVKNAASSTSDALKNAGKSITKGILPTGMGADEF
jgi:F0F1-type ATP synthase membrane subunit b/b'